MANPSRENITIARTVGDVFGGDWNVHEYHDDSRKDHVDVLSSTNQPQKGVTSFATVGLSDSTIFKDGRPLQDVRVELVGACASAFRDFPNVLASAAFEVIKEREFIAPGVIFPGFVARYRKKSPMRNAMFVPPFLWPDLATLELSKKTVAWLLLVPVSDAEMKYACDQGPAKLEELFAKEEIDIFDIDRPSVL
jgi:hypothetical protein